MERIQDKNLKELIKKCLEPEETRPYAQDLLKLPYLYELESEENNQPVKLKEKSRNNSPTNNLYAKQSTLFKNIKQKSN